VFQNSAREHSPWFLHLARQPAGTLHHRILLLRKPTSKIFNAVY